MKRKMNRENSREEMRRPPTPEEFIKAWQTSKTLREACSRLRMKRAVAKVRAYRYRERGVPLKQHEVDPPVECYPDWDELAKYAASLVAPGEESNDVPVVAPQVGSAPAPA
jgi:hypothetical protein